MTAKVKHKRRLPRSCQECEHWNEVRDKLRVGEVLESVVEKMQGKIEANEFKPTVADFLRLLQLEQEIGEEEPKEIKVTWVDPTRPRTEK